MQHGVAMFRSGKSVTGVGEGANLFVENIADAAIGAGFAKPPCDFLNDPRGAPQWRQCFLHVRHGQRGFQGRAGAGEDHFDGRENFGMGRYGRCYTRRRCGCCQFSTAGRKALFEPLDGLQHHGGIGVAVAACIFAEKPASARGFHEGFTDRVVVGVGWRGAPCRDRR